MDGGDRYAGSSRPRGRGFNFMMSNFIQDPHANHETKRNHVSRLRSQIQASVDVYDMDSEIMPLNDDVFMEDGSYGYSGGGGSGGNTYSNAPIDSNSYTLDNFNECSSGRQTEMANRPNHQRGLYRQNEMEQPEVYLSHKDIILSHKDSANYSIEEDNNARYLNVNSRRENYSVDSGLVNRISNESCESFQSFPSIPSTSGPMPGQANQSSNHFPRKFRHKQQLYSSPETIQNQDLETDHDKYPPFSPLQRTASYEMATGKLEAPDVFGSSNWKDAILLLKKKRDNFFSRAKNKTIDAPELVDPVYHLLKCAASQNHMATTCRCPCHIKELGDNSDELLSFNQNFKSSPALTNNFNKDDAGRDSDKTKGKSESSVKSFFLRRNPSTRSSSLSNKERTKSRTSSRSRSFKQKS